MARIWRQKVGKDVWHFVRWCRNWPLVVTEKQLHRAQMFSSGDAVRQVQRKPSSGEFCDECMSKEKRRFPVATTNEAEEWRRWQDGE